MRISGYLLILELACSRRVDEPQLALEREVMVPVDGGAACGRPPLPQCPLQNWMESNLAGAFAGGQMDRLEGPLESLAQAVPVGYVEWSQFARRGAQAARNGDREGVRGTCGACHRAYRQRFRNEGRGRPLPAALAQLP